ncbi:Superoxide dismutase [Cu-Zn] [Zancudomyces culisetae]|uniref:Superoxide dismutase [Cu-Zn] n=1 Tax=Zancudomyces culisetae TaxID=1213189 RepID=A0A1R1PM45_ZANCU|nr:Superoxide dismutase [Cu-Zn] [Zancudomyces culisetae]|eukprot:OMH82035.1 Superoxide dismutase [Cu-Zn] [Zancudomyces culisetae]
MVNASCIVVGAAKILGTIYFKQEAPGSVVKITGSLEGLTPGLHGFHIHEFGDTSNACMGAGTHYNPTGHVHGDVNDSARHVGDLGNISADDSGKATINIDDDGLNLYGPISIMGWHRWCDIAALCLHGYLPLLVFRIYVKKTNKTNNDFNRRGLVVHAQRDDLGKGGNSTSLETGNAGGRVGCCVIGYTKGE